MDTKARYRTEGGFAFGGISAADYGTLLQELDEQVGISPLQAVEAASYSMAMVVRVALGLSAAGAKVSAITNDSLAGWTALATMRHLANAGCACAVIEITCGKRSIDCERQLKPLRHHGVKIVSLAEADLIGDNSDEIVTSHAVICGINAGDHLSCFAGMIDFLNELQTPIHCIQLPLGVDADTGIRSGVPLFASSTLSLGAPLVGLNRGSEYAGRHYLCDASVPADLYRKYTGDDLSSLFAEQPVVQIFPQA